MEIGESLESYFLYVHCHLPFSSPEGSWWSCGCSAGGNAVPSQECQQWRWTRPLSSASAHTIFMNKFMWHQHGFLIVMMASSISFTLALPLDAAYWILSIIFSSLTWTMMRYLVIAAPLVWVMLWRDAICHAFECDYYCYYYYVRFTSLKQSACCLLWKKSLAVFIFFFFLIDLYE